MGTWASHPIAASRASATPGVRFGFGSAVADYSDRCRCTSATFVTSRKGGTLFLCATTLVVASTLVVTRLTDTNGITFGCCSTSLVAVVSAVSRAYRFRIFTLVCRQVGTFHLTRFANDIATVQTAYTSLTRWFSEARLVDFEARARVSINALKKTCFIRAANTFRIPQKFSHRTVIKSAYISNILFVARTHAGRAHERCALAGCTNARIFATRFSWSEARGVIRNRFCSAYATQAGASRALGNRASRTCRGIGQVVGHANASFAITTTFAGLVSVEAGELIVVQTCCTVIIISTAWATFVSGNCTSKRINNRCCMMSKTCREEGTMLR